MSKRGWFIIGIYILILFIATGMIFGRKIFPEKKIHYHAGFVVFQDNKKLDFSDNKYMNVKPCTTGEEEDEAGEDEQIEKAHLHDNVGDVVHIEQIDAKWKDLFINLHYAMDYSKVTAYINGQKVSNFENQPIRAYDSVVVFIGNVDEKRLQEAVKKNYIMEKEKKSDGC
jgi:hypothetical protein